VPWILTAIGQKELGKADTHNTIIQVENTGDIDDPLMKSK